MKNILVNIDVIRNIVIKFVLSKIRIIMELSERIAILINNNDLNGAVHLLDKAIDETPDSADAYFERGKLHWRLGNRREAINDYTRASRLDPDSPASEALKHSMEIMSFFNPDLYNP